MDTSNLRISLTNKIFLFFVILSLGVALITSIYSYRSTRNALLDRTYKQLISVRVLKKKQIENFINDRINEVNHLAKSNQTKEIIETFSKNQNKKENYQDVNLFIKNSNYFDNLFISNFNNCLMLSGDSNIRQCILNDNISSDSKIYPIIKLKDRVIKAKTVVIKDFQFNDKGVHTNKLYIGAPVIVNGIVCGMAALDLSSDAINNIMLVQDSRSGLGESGETYLVGEDYYMRSSSRFKKDSFLSIKVKTIASENALNKIENTEIIYDYRGIKVLSSYSKLDIPDLNWVILTEIDFSEVMKNATSDRNKTIFFCFIICLFILPISYLLAGKITYPIIRLNHAINQVSEGSYDIYVKNTTHDEIGSLTDSFNLMTERLREQTKEVKEREERLQHFYDATKDAILLHNNNIPVLFNQTACHLTGYSEDELLRMKIDSFLLIRTDSETSKPTSKNIVYETILVKKDQTLMEVEVQENAIEYKSNFIRAIVIRDISRRKKAEKALDEEREKRLSSLIDGQEMERQRLSRELHDSLGQSLIAIKLKLESAVDADIIKTRTIIDSAKELFDNTIDEVRRISNNLMPAVLYEFGLQTALSNLCKRIEETAHIEVRFYSNLKKENYDIKIKTYIYRISQEALNNCVKHSKASLVEVYLLESIGNIKLIIKDNGKGFIFDKNYISSGNGLLNMKERAQLINAKFEIKTACGQGTEINIVIPIKNHEQQD